jgi:hypothetical protein
MNAPLAGELRCYRLSGPDDLSSKKNGPVYTTGPSRGGSRRSSILFNGRSSEMFHRHRLSYRNRADFDRLEPVVGGQRRIAPSGLLARTVMRPTGPAFGRPDDKLCPRCPTSPFDRVGKVARGQRDMSSAAAGDFAHPTRFHMTGTLSSVRPNQCGSAAVASRRVPRAVVPSAQQGPFRFGQAEMGAAKVSRNVLRCVPKWRGRPKLFFSRGINRAHIELLD